VAPGAGRAVHVHVDAPVEVVFAWFADPVNRPAWQSSLRDVAVLTDGPPALGTRWLDRTVVGMTPEMTTSVFDPPYRWAEVGTWRGVTAELALDLARTGGGTEGAGTDVTARFTLIGRGGWRPVAAVAARLAVPAIRSDLRRAARLVGKG
jgi:hypothetical protein